MDTRHSCGELARGGDLPDTKLQILPHEKHSFVVNFFCRATGQSSISSRYFVEQKKFQEAFFVEVELLANEGHGCVLAAWQQEATHPFASSEIFHRSEGCWKIRCSKRFGAPKLETSEVLSVSWVLRWCYATRSRSYLSQFHSLGLGRLDLSTHSRSMQK